MVFIDFEPKLNSGNILTVLKMSVDVDSTNSEPFKDDISFNALK